MIFVNDFWSLTGVPIWLEHAKADQDFLGFSDIIFPCFLFILGMAIPYAVRNRLARGDSRSKILIHIVLRSLSLLVMGFFTVNIGHLNDKASGISREWFEILMVIGFFLRWNLYPKATDWKKYLYTGLQISGVLMLILLFLIFRGGKDGAEFMKPSWWGILGLIGWTYLISALLYLYTGKSPLILISLWILFTIINIASQAGVIHTPIPGGGAFQGFAFAGIAATLLLDRATTSERRSKLPLFYLGAGTLLILAGLGLRNFFIISKIHATPPWVFLCNGIAFGFLALVYYIVDLKGKAKWFYLIKPAGTSTLTCYLIPYVYYSIGTFMFTLPAFLSSGAVGLLKSFIYAMIIIGLTALLGKLRIKLKI